MTNTSERTRKEEDAKVPLAVVEVPIDDLCPDAANPRRISEGQIEALTRNIQTYGFVQPVLARKEDKKVIGGHQRLVAARRLGYQTVPTIFLDISLKEARLLGLGLNKISGDWDQELLARLLADLSTEEVDLPLFGFEDGEVAKLLKTLEQREKRERAESFDLDAALEATGSAPRAQQGETWALGEHRLLCGDSTDAAVVGRLMKGAKAAMAFTDPPYNVALGDHGGQGRGQRRRRIENDALAPEQWEAFCRSWACNLLAAVNGALYVCMSSKEWPLVSRVLEEEGAHWSDTIIWQKDRFVLGRADYQRAYEPIWYGWREGAPHHWCGDRDQGDIWRVDRPSVSEAHPTMKPLRLVERALENGKRYKSRVCYGVEIHEHYASVAIARRRQQVRGSHGP